MLDGWWGHQSIRKRNRRGLMRQKDIEVQLSMQLDDQVGIAIPELKAYSSGQEGVIKVVEVSRSLSVCRWELRWVFTQTSG